MRHGHRHGGSGFGTLAVIMVLAAMGGCGHSSKAHASSGYDYDVGVRAVVKAHHAFDLNSSICYAGGGDDPDAYFFHAPAKTVLVGPRWSADRMVFDRVFKRSRRRTGQHVVFDGTRFYNGTSRRVVVSAWCV
jgi:hypothetical protein